MNYAGRMTAGNGRPLQGRLASCLLPAVAMTAGVGRVQAARLRQPAADSTGPCASFRRSLIRLLSVLLARLAWVSLVLWFALFFSPGGARATDYTWNVDANGYWTTNSNWSPNTSNPKAGGDKALDLTRTRQVC